VFVVGSLLVGVRPFVISLMRSLIWLRVSALSVTMM